ncbi:MAG: cytochrome c biogenesis protein CcsA [Candidatus Krumholzibacteriota bacterium]|nr:cytochrome c biogenesis protein CcsA [Candidatus Krumholzibacteriota bacterium]
MQTTLDISLFWIAFWVYLASFLLFVIFFGVKKRLLGKIAAIVFFAAIALHTGGIIERYRLTGHLPLATMFEYSLLLSWFIAVSFFVVISKYGLMISGLVISPVIIIVMVIAAFLPKEGSKHMMPALQSYWLYIHITLAALAEGAFFTAAGAGVYYLFGSVRKGIDFKNREAVEGLIIKSIRIGYPLFTIGALFAGSLWAWKAWGSFWSWDPKETGALVVWLFYTLLLHQQSRGRWRGRRLAILSIAGFLIIIISFLGTLFLGGLHAYI